MQLFVSDMEEEDFSGFSDCDIKEMQCSFGGNCSGFDRLSWSTWIFFQAAIFSLFDGTSRFDVDIFLID